MESTVDVFEMITTLRAARAEAVALASGGDLTTVFELSPESPSAFVYVVKLLDVHPALGKVKGRRLMAQLGLDQFVRVSELSAHDKSKILEACRTVA